METRQLILNQIKLYTLVLNQMLDPKIEMGRIAAFSTEYDKLIEWYNAQKADEPYSDKYCDRMYYKVFKKDSPLEWFNPADDLRPGELNHFGQGIKEEWILDNEFEAAKQRYLFIE